jgi:hypothetical protein
MSRDRTLTEHCQLKGYFHKLGVTNRPICEQCLQKINQPHISYVIVRLLLTDDWVKWVTALWNQVTTITPL